MPRIRQITPGVTQLKRKMRVAAYARVSEDCEVLLHSLSAQVSYYSTLIQNNPEWEYAGVYVDQGITGTSTAHSDGFNRLVADCDAGKIDMVLVKSISRFAGDTVDCLNTTRHLKDLGISVYFEREKINSLSEVGELMLTLLASFARKKVGAFQRISNGLPESGLSKVSQTVTKHPTAMNGTERCSASSPNRARW